MVGPKKFLHVFDQGLGLMVRVCSAMLVAVCALLFADPGFAEVRALLIGVSDYDESLGIADLKGPANDIVFLRDVLTGRGVSDISVLADRVPDGGAPTHAAILEGFAALARREIGRAHV